MKIKLELTIPEINLLLEAITAANKLAEGGQTIYNIGGYESETLESQLQDVAIITDIADKLQAIIDEEQTALIVFNP